MNIFSVAYRSRLSPEENPTSEILFKYEAVYYFQIT